MSVETQERLGELRVQRRLAHSIEEVWGSLTQPEQVQQWMKAPNASVDGWAGGHVDIDAPLHVTGRILAWEPPKLFEHEFKLAPSRLMPAGEDGVLRYELEPDGDGCVLTMTFMRLTAATARLFGGGIKSGLDRLEAHLASRHPKQDA
jgi:uncharacterized protein YndB with AHSA1/START domain